MSVVENEKMEAITIWSGFQLSKIIIKRYKVINEKVPSTDEGHMIQSKQSTKITLYLKSDNTQLKTTIPFKTSAPHVPFL